MQFNHFRGRLLRGAVVPDSARFPSCRKRAGFDQRTKIEKEKFPFYRGVGNFTLPLSVKIDGKNPFLKDSGGKRSKKPMIATWKDSWIEQGLRVLYFLTEKTTDKKFGRKSSSQLR